MHLAKKQRILWFMSLLRKHACLFTLSFEIVQASAHAQTEYLRLESLKQIVAVLKIRLDLLLTSLSLCRTITEAMKCQITDGNRVNCCF